MNWDVWGIGNQASIWSKHSTGKVESLLQKVKRYNCNQEISTPMTKEAMIETQPLCIRSRRAVTWIQDSSV